MNKKLILSVLAASALAGSAVSAAPIPLTLPAGPVFIQYNNAERTSFSNSILIPGGGGATEGNWGIVQISSVQVGTVLPPTGSDIGGGGSTIFTNGAGGAQILGIFDGAKFGCPSSGCAPGDASGGRLDLYWWQGAPLQNVSVELANPLAPAKYTAINQYTGFTCAGGNTANCTLLASFNFVSGAEPGVPGVTITSPVVPGTLDGTSKSYLSVDTSVVGAWTTALDTNFFTLDSAGNPVGFVYPGGVSYPAAADVRLDNNFSANGGGAWSIKGTDIVGLRSNDPARGFAVPEPGTVALMGLALAIAGGLARRRRSGEGSAV